MHTPSGHDTQRPQLPGEMTLLGSWGALAAHSAGAHLAYTQTSFAAVFPQWDALNNAILLDPPSIGAASAAAAELADVYRGVGVDSWALWLPARPRTFTASDEISAVHGMVRDATTLVMTAELDDGVPSHPGVLETTVEMASQVGELPVAAAAVPDCPGGSDIMGWALIEDEMAVAGAWTYRIGNDVGVYAVGTAPGWRRRGLGRALMLHVLAAAYRNGARTASLQSTVMGEPLYRSLGFRPAGRYEEWVPAPARSCAEAQAEMAS